MYQGGGQDLRGGDERSWSGGEVVVGSDQIWLRRRFAGPAGFMGCPPHPSRDCFWVAIWTEPNRTAGCNRVPPPSRLNGQDRAADGWPMGLVGHLTAQYWRASFVDSMGFRCSRNIGPTRHSRLLESIIACLELWGWFFFFFFRTLNSYVLGPYSLELPPTTTLIGELTLLKFNSGLFRLRSMFVISKSPIGGMGWGIYFQFYVLWRWWHSACSDSTGQKGYLSSSIAGWRMLLIGGMHIFTHHPHQT